MLDSCLHMTRILGRDATARNSCNMLRNSCSTHSTYIVYYRQVEAPQICLHLTDMPPLDRHDSTWQACLHLTLFSFNSNLSKYLIGTHVTRPQYIHLNQVVPISNLSKYLKGTHVTRPQYIHLNQVGPTSNLSTYRIGTHVTRPQYSWINQSQSSCPISTQTSQSV